MKKFTKVLLGLMIIPFISLTSCKKDAPDAPASDASLSFKTLKTYLVANNLDMNNILDGWITTADAVNTVMTDADATNDYYIIDIRSAADYNTGHIESAVNTTLGSIVTQAASASGKPILVVCYSGQGAAHGAVALRLSGYKTAKTLKWGMSGWNANLSGPWDVNTADNGAANWAAAPGNLTANATHGDPEYTTTATEGAAILTERVAAMLAGGFKGVTGTEAAGNPGNYFINNYWAASDVEHYGHITGAYRILPLTLAGGEYANLDASKKIVTYCWTGQTSSMVTAYLNVLGYDAYSLLFGANNLIHSALQSHAYTPAEHRDYPVVATK